MCPLNRSNSRYLYIWVNQTRTRLEPTHLESRFTLGTFSGPCLFLCSVPTRAAGVPLDWKLLDAYNVHLYVMYIALCIAAEKDLVEVKTPL